jgi:hypothetical protein
MARITSCTLTLSRHIARTPPRQSDEDTAALSGYSGQFLIDHTGYEFLMA